MHCRPSIDDTVEIVSTEGDSLIVSFGGYHMYFPYERRTTSADYNSETGELKIRQDLCVNLNDIPEEFAHRAEKIQALLNKFEPW